MEIERINENTIKFFISYVDIEERGFDREEIWYNRERSEELFWEMMDEIHQEEKFSIEGPLWIQVQALEKGLEVLVTKAHLSNDAQKFDLPFATNTHKGRPTENNMESLLNHHFSSEETESGVSFYEDKLDFLVVFEDFENVISLASRFQTEDFQTKLFSLENKYYLYVEFDEDLVGENEIDNILSVFLEYGNETMITIHRLEEYGKEIVSENVLQTINKYFC